LANWKKVKIIRPGEENKPIMTLIDLDDLGLATGGGFVSATIANLSSITDVTVNGASANDVLLYGGGGWQPYAISSISLTPPPSTITASDIAPLIHITASDVLPAYPMDGYYYGLVYSATGYAWKKYTDQAHFVSFNATLSVNPSSLEEGRGVSAVTLTIASTNPVDFPLTGYTAVGFNGSGACSTAISGTQPTIVYHPIADFNSPAAFSMTIEAGAESVVKSVSVNYYFLKYWGCNSATALSDTDIKALPSQSFATAKAGTYTFNTCATGKYLWVCWPTTLGTATSFTVAGLLTTFIESTVSVCNTYSAVRNVYCYKSQETQFGTAVSVVIV